MIDVCDKVIAEKERQEERAERTKVVPIVPESGEKLPDTIVISSIAPVSQAPTHQTRRHSITLDLDDISIIKKAIGVKAEVFLKMMIEFGKDEIISGQKQEIEIFAFAKRYDLDPGDVHKVFNTIKDLYVVGQQLKIPFVYSPQSED